MRHQLFHFFRAVGPDRNKPSKALAVNVSYIHKNNTLVSLRKLGYEEVTEGPRVEVSVAREEPRPDTPALVVVETIDADVPLPAVPIHAHNGNSSIFVFDKKEVAPTIGAETDILSILSALNECFDLGKGDRMTTSNEAFGEVIDTGLVHPEDCLRDLLEGQLFFELPDARFAFRPRRLDLRKPIVEVVVAVIIPRTDEAFPDPLLARRRKCDFLHELEQIGGLLDDGRSDLIGHFEDDFGFATQVSEDFAELGFVLGHHSKITRFKTSFAGGLSDFVHESDTDIGRIRHDANVSFLFWTYQVSRHAIVDLSKFGEHRPFRVWLLRRSFNPPRRMDSKNAVIRKISICYPSIIIHLT